MKNQIEQEKTNDYVEKIQEIFEYYCQYGERLNSTILKSHKYIKLFRESGLMDKKIDTTRLEIIYKSINKNNQMNFNQFLNSLLKIAAYKYDLLQKSDIKKGTQKIIIEYILPLYNLINSENLPNDQQNETKTINDLYISNINYNKNFESCFYSDIFKEILIQVVPVLFDIYKTFFSNEISISDDIKYIKDTSLKNYFTFIKQLEIIPKLLSKSTCYHLYKYETENNNSNDCIKQNKDFYFEVCQKIDFQNFSTFDRTNKNIFGKYFIFFKFIRILVKMSQIVFSKISENNEFCIKSEEMFILFLQKLEQTEGFSNFTKVNNTTHNHKTTTIIPPNFYEKYKMLIGDNENNNTEDNKSNSINNKKEMFGENEKIDLSKRLDMYEPVYVNYINEVYGKELLNLYKTLVSFGDQFNFQFMKSKTFYKFLLDSNLVQDKNNNFGLKVNEIDSFFIKMCLLMKRNNSSNEKKCNTVNVSYGEIDFTTFIISIELLARILVINYPLKQAIDIFIVEFILKNKELQNSKINTIDEKIENLKELQNNQEIIDILNVLHKAFYQLFIYYSKENDGLLSNKNFMQFAKDFEIFPYLISKAKLNSFFIGLAQYSSYGDENNLLIEYSLFVDLIALMSFELIYPSPEPSPVEKILIFVDKLSKSQGPNKIVLNIGSNRNEEYSNFIGYFKKFYPSYFNEEEPVHEDFSSIMQEDNDENEMSGNKINTKESNDKTDEIGIENISDNYNDN